MAALNSLLISTSSQKPCVDCNHQISYALDRI